MSDRLMAPSSTAENHASSTPETIISVRAASRVYPVGATQVTALKDVTLEVPRGILGALRGRSGSGKTTLLNLMGGLDQPTTGEVFLFGHSLSHRSSDELARLRRQRIGFVFQSFAIMPNFSALENVELMLRIAGVRRERRSRAMRCLDIVGLGAWAHHRPWEMSGGQQQRVAIARALAPRPAVILADEPTGELDSETAQDVLTLFRQIMHEEEMTMLMASHDSLVDEYVDQVLHLQDGVIAQVVRNDN